jgi:competence protein ComEC
VGRSQRLALGAVAAAVAAGQITTSHLAAAVALAMAAVLLIGQMRGWTVARGLWPLIVGAGLVVTRVALTAPPVGLAEPPMGDGPWRLQVEAVGSPRDGLQTATLGSRPGTDPAFRVAATLPRYPEVVPGDRVVVSGSIRPRPESPYGEYLERVGAIGTVTARSLAVEPPSADLGRDLENLRRAAADALAEALPEPEAGLATGILVGLRDRVDRDLAAAFTTAGVSHVVAISGWNIAIVAAVAGSLGRRRRSVVTIAAITAYALFAGASPSVVRAALMAAVVLLARESGRAGRAAAALAWAAVLLLLIDPGLVRDAGFQLSSLATAGLIAWATPLTEWFEALGGGRVPRWLAESLGVSIAAQAATLPIVLASFGRLAILSPVVNLVVVPLVAPAMAAGLVALAGGAVVLAGGPSIAGAVLAAPGWVILRTLVAVVETGAGLPFASVTLEPPLDVGGALGAVAGIYAVTWWARHRRQPDRHGKRPTVAPVAPEPRRVDQAAAPRGGVARRASLLALVLSLAVAGAVVAVRSPAVARVSVLDVGQGDAILVEGSRGGRLLIDGGPDPDRLLVALDRRIPPWDRRIDAVVLSHPHEDHVAGLPLLLARYRVYRVFEPGMRGPGPGYAAWARRLASPGSPFRLAIAAGDRLTVDEISLHVMWPVRGKVPVDPPDGGTGINNVSVVLLGEVGPRRFLLMGDVEEEIDPSLVSGGLPHVDLLKVAHHGSRTATTEPFVETVRPTVAVASAGAGNPYGHPAASTLKRLVATGARVLRTDRDGTVVATFATNAMTVRTEGVAGTAGPGGRLGQAETTLAATRATATRRRAARFLCAVPVTTLVPAAAAAPVRDPVRPMPHRRTMRADEGGLVGRLDPCVAAVSGSRGGRRTRLRPIARSRAEGGEAAVGYHRADVGARPRGGRHAPALPRSPTLVRAPFPRRRGGGGLVGGADRGARHRRGPPRRRGRRPPSRCRQGAAGRRSRAGFSPWRGIRGLARQGRSPRAGAGRCESPRHPSRR